MPSPRPLPPPTPPPSPPPQHNLGAYDEAGHTKALPAAAGGEGRRCSRPVSSSGDVSWARLPWALTRDAEAAIDASRGALGALSDDLDLQIVSFSQVGGAGGAPEDGGAGGAPERL